MYKKLFNIPWTSVLDVSAAQMIPMNEERRQLAYQRLFAAKNNVTFNDEVEKRDVMQELTEEIFHMELEDDQQVPSEEQKKINGRNRVYSA